MFWTQFKKNTVFWNIIHCSLVVTNVSEEPAASIFREEYYAGKWYGYIEEETGIRVPSEPIGTGVP
jgi:hypothetical protein